LDSLFKEKVNNLETTINEQEIQLHSSQASRQKLSEQVEELLAEQEKISREKDDHYQRITYLASEKESLFTSNQSEVQSLSAQLEKSTRDFENLRQVNFFPAKINFQATDTEKLRLQTLLSESTTQSQKSTNDLNRAKLELEMKLRGEIELNQRQAAEALALKGREHIQELTSLEQKMEQQQANEIQLLSDQFNGKIKDYEISLEEWKGRNLEMEQILEKKNEELNEQIQRSEMQLKHGSSLNGENGKIL
jgi:hypothetical protein